MDRAPDVSIVLCTYNRADMLRECVESLLAQQTNGEFTFEVLVVDNRSTDGTADLVAEMQETSPVPLRYVMEPQAGQVFARHRGFDEARGEWFANFDDDEVAEPGWVLEMLRVARSQNVRSVGGLLWLRLPPDCKRNLHPRVRRILGESVTWETPRPYTRRQGPGSGTQLIHRSVLEEVGRYDVSQSLRGYDTDLYRRMREAGIVSWFAPKSVAYHVTPPSRLTYGYLHETCFHDGFTFCRRDLQHFGKLLGLPVMLLRLLNAVGRHAPVALLAKLIGNRETALAHWLMLVRAEGYARCYMHLVAPAFPQRGVLQRYGIIPRPTSPATNKAVVS
ncbi:MAG: glycosyltransferase [Pirellulaceae bacterium]